MNCHDDQEGKKKGRWSSLKGTLIMALCCGAPLLVLLALGPLGGAIGGRGGLGGLSFLAVLLCPLSMFLMMYLMGRGMSRKEGSGKPAEMAGMQDQPKVGVNQDPASTEQIASLTEQVESLEETVRQLRARKDGNGSQSQVVLHERKG